MFIGGLNWETTDRKSCAPNFISYIESDTSYIHDFAMEPHRAHRNTC
jgi:hypothetical protein